MVDKCVLPLAIQGSSFHFDAYTRSIAHRLMTHGIVLDCFFFFSLLCVCGQVVAEARAQVAKDRENGKMEFPKLVTLKSEAAC